jgi:hypothetical protein
MASAELSRRVGKVVGYPPLLTEDVCALRGVAVVSGDVSPAVDHAEHRLDA